MSRVLWRVSINVFNCNESLMRSFRRTFYCPQVKIFRGVSKILLGPFNNWLHALYGSIVNDDLCPLEFYCRIHFETKVKMAQHRTENVMNKLWRNRHAFTPFVKSTRLMMIQKVGTHFEFVVFVSNLKLYYNTLHFTFIL